VAVLVKGVDPSGAAEAIVCSGVLVARNVVLTARHCFSATEGPSDRTSCEASRFVDDVPLAANYEVLRADGDARAAVEIAVPPDGNGLCGYDIALVRVSPSFDLDAPAVPRLDAEVRSGEPYRALGFGATGIDGELDLALRERRSLAVQCLERACDPADGVAGGEWLGQGGICAGDSGGPAIDGNGYVIGVALRSNVDDCGDAVYTSVSRWREWIRETVGDFGRAESRARPGWLDRPTITGGTIPPADSSCALAGAPPGRPGGRGAAPLALAALAARAARVARRSGRAAAARARALGGRAPFLRAPGLVEQRAPAGERFVVDGGRG
jgi:hypothetical protein